MHEIDRSEWPILSVSGVSSTRYSSSCMSSDIVPGSRKHAYSGVEVFKFAMTESAKCSVDFDDAWGMPRCMGGELDSEHSLMSATHD